MSLLLGSIPTYRQINSNIEVGRPTIPINGGKTIQKNHPFGNGLMVDYCFTQTSLYPYSIPIFVLSLSCCNYHALPLTIWLNTHTLCIEIPKINKPCRSFNHGRGRWWGRPTTNSAIHCIAQDTHLVAYVFWHLIASLSHSAKQAAQLNHRISKNLHNFPINPYKWSQKNMV